MSSTKTENFREILESFDTAMLVTHAADGRLRARPMAVAEINSESNLLFITSEQSAKIDEIEADPRVCVAFQSTTRFLSITGTSKVSSQRSRIETLWQESWRVWFPEGKEDPTITLIEVNSEEGEYWDRSGLQRMKYLFEAGKAYVSGDRPETGADLHGKVELER